MPAFGPCRRACGCAGLFFLPPDSAVLSVFVASLFAPSFFPSSVFLLPARISLCPHFPLPVFLSARVSPALSVRPPSSVFRLVFLLSFLVFPFIVHRLPFVVRRPLRRPSFIARRLLSVARCAVHRPSPAACCPSPIVYPLLPIVYPLLPVARNLPPAVHRPPLVGGCPYPVPRTPYPAASLSAAVRSGSRLLYPRNPGLRVCGSCLPCRSAAGSVGRSFRKNASALRTLVAAPFLTK